MADPKNPSKNANETIVDLVKAAQVVPAEALELADGRIFVVSSNEYRLQDVSLPNVVKPTRPQIVAAHVKLHTEGAFIDYVNRFKALETMIFADTEQETVTAIIDYHIPESAEIEQLTQAGFCQHRAILKLKQSLEWKTWTDKSDRLMPHVAFANFLEENAGDVVSPPGADLLELCRDLEVTSGYSFKAGVRMGDVTELKYQKADDATSKGGIGLPVSFGLSIPVFEERPQVSIRALTRRKIEDGTLSLGYVLQRAAAIRREEFYRIANMIQAGTGQPLVFGSPT